MNGTRFTPLPLATWHGHGLVSVRARDRRRTSRSGTSFCVRVVLAGEAVVAAACVDGTLETVELISEETLAVRDHLRLERLPVSAELRVVACVDLAARPVLGQADDPRQFHDATA